MVTIRFFAGAAEAAGTNEIQIDVSSQFSNEGAAGKTATEGVATASATAVTDITATEAFANTAPESVTDTTSDGVAGTVPASDSPAIMPTVGDLLDQVAQGNEKLQKVLSVCLLLADGERVERTSSAAGISQLDILPPFAGG